MTDCYLNRAERASDASTHPWIVQRAYFHAEIIVGRQRSEGPRYGRIERATIALFPVSQFMLPRSGRLHAVRIPTRPTEATLSITRSATVPRDDTRT